MWNKAEFQAICSDCLPPSLQHTIEPLWHGFTRQSALAAHPSIKSHAALRERVQSILDSPPSFSSFAAAIQEKRKSSSPGVCGLTYQLMQLWPMELLQVLYAALCEAWATRTTPELWKWRMVVYIPKEAGNKDIDMLRPIMLIEPLRKLWVHLIIHRVFQLWDVDEHISSMQWGYRHHRSTFVPATTVLNSFEHAKDNRERLFFSSWDFQKAFDSVSNFFKELSYTRLGMPTDVTRWLEDMDNSGHTIVKTPFAADALATSSRHHFLPYP